MIDKDKLQNYLKERTEELRGHNENYVSLKNVTTAEESKNLDILIKINEQRIQELSILYLKAEIGDFDIE